MTYRRLLVCFIVGVFSTLPFSAEAMDDLLSKMDAANAKPASNEKPVVEKADQQEAKEKKSSPKTTEAEEVDQKLPALEFVDLEPAKEDEEEVLYDQLMADEDDTVNLPSFNVDQTFSFKDDTLTGVNKSSFPNQFPNNKVPIMDDPWKYMLKFTGNITFGGPKKNDWGFKVTVPFVYNDPGDLIKNNLKYLSSSNPTKPPSNTARKFAAQDSEFGLGDINMKLKRSFGITKDLRTSFGVLLGFPTGEDYDQGTKTSGEVFDYNLGQGQYRCEFDNALSYRLDKVYTLTLNTALKYGVKKDHDGDEQLSGFIKPGINIMLPHKCIFSLSYNAKYNFNSQPRYQYMHDGKIKISKRVGKCNVGLAYQNPLGIKSYYAHNFDLNCSYNF